MLNVFNSAWATVDTRRETGEFIRSDHEHDRGERSTFLLSRGSTRSGCNPAIRASLARLDEWCPSKRPGVSDRMSHQILCLAQCRQRPISAHRR